MRKIDNIYVIIMCIFCNLIDYSICGSNVQHSMLAFPKENTFLKKMPRDIPKTYFIIFGISL